MLIKLGGLIAIEQVGRQTRSLSSAQAQVAFARLTLERVTGTSRDQLADTIWPEGLPETWSSALRSVVSRVRAFANGAEPQQRAELVAYGGRYLLRFYDEVVVDVERAEAEVHQAAQAFAVGAFDDAQSCAGRAIGCLRNRFLPEHEGEWVNTIRERFDALLVQSLETASLSASALGDERAALRWAEEAVGRAPLRESAHRCLMTAHAAAGNRAEALRSYNDIRRALAEELGVDPDPETQATYLKLLSDPVARPIAPSTRKTGLRPGSQAAFVGRRAELARLAEAWTSVADGGENRMVLLCGPRGIGKTRLATKAAERVGMSGGLILYGQCDQTTEAPFQPIVSALADFVAAPDLSGETSAGTRAALDVLSRAAHAVPAKRAELMVQLGDVLMLIAAAQPTMLLLDDVEGADSETFGLINHLLTSRHQAPLLIVGTAAECLPRLRQLGRTGRLDLMMLDGLDETSALELVRRCFPQHTGVPELRPHRLIADTAGNPFLLLELLRWYRDGHGAAASALPAGIHDYAASRIAGLDSAPLQLLRAAATSGVSFELDLIAEAAELDLTRALDSLDVLKAQGLIVEDPGEGHTHRHEGRFRYDVLRRAVYEGLTDARRRWLHTRLADAIELHRSDHTVDYSMALARHRAAGATPYGDQRAVRSGWLAAARASQTGAADAAVQFCHRALQHTPHTDGELHAEARTRLGLAQLAAGHAGSAQTLLDGAVRSLHSGRLNVAAEAALGLAEAVTSHPALRSEAEALIATLLTVVSQPEQGQRTVTALDDLTVGRLLARQARLGGPISAVASVRAAVDAFLRELRALEGPDRAARRYLLAGEAHDLARASGDRGAAVLAAHHLATAASMTGDHSGLDQALVQLSAAAGGDRVAEWTVDRLLMDFTVARAVTRGRFNDALAAEALADPAVDSLTSAVQPAPGQMGRRQIFVAEWLRAGAWSTAQPHAQDPVEQAFTALIRGERGRAHLRLRAIATGMEPMARDDMWLHRAGVLALGSYELGDPTTAEATRSLLLPYADRVCAAGYRSFVGPVSLHLGRLSIVVGDWHEAERQLTMAMTQLGSRNAKPWIALAQQSLARVLQSRARPSDRRWVQELQAEAGRILTSLGVPCG